MNDYKNKSNKSNKSNNYSYYVNNIILDINILLQVKIIFGANTSLIL